MIHDSTPNSIGDTALQRWNWAASWNKCMTPQVAGQFAYRQFAYGQFAYRQFAQWTVCLMTICLPDTLPTGHNAYGHFAYWISYFLKNKRTYLYLI